MSKPAHSKPSAAIRTVPMFEAAAQPPPAPPPLQLTLALAGAQHAFEVFPSERTAHAIRGVERFIDWVYSRHRSAVRLAEGQKAAPAASTAALVAMSRHAS